MRSVTVVGAGFSGLTLAYYLQKEGLQVTLVECQARCGGLISSVRNEFGLVESAANALLADVDTEALFKDLGVEFATRGVARKKRYIFWNSPSRWPLSLFSTLRLMWFGFLFKLGVNSVLPRPEESVRTWARRVVDIDFEQRLLTPALQGIYAGDSGRLSAQLLISGMLSGQKKKGALQGSVAPKDGMGALIEALRVHIVEAGAKVMTHTQYELPQDLKHPTVICTSAWDAAKIVLKAQPDLAMRLERCESLPIVSVTAFFEPHSDDLQGFGCLFPRSRGFTSLGVLFNSVIFGQRSRQRSETWIMGGADHPGIVDFSDDEILAILCADRLLFSGKDVRPIYFKISRWPRGLPHYTVEWERELRDLQIDPPLFLHGNYLGDLGLARIRARSQNLARRIKDEYV